MSLPIVIIKSLVASNATSIAASQGAGTSIITLNGGLATGGIATLDSQRRVQIASLGNEATVTITIIGTNEATNGIRESLLGPNASTTQTLNSFKTVTAVTLSTTLTSSITIGTNANGESLWQTMNLQVSPFNCEIAVVPTTAAAVTFAAQYTYDDPNNLPSGVTIPTAFNHPTVTGSASIDGSLLSPVVATRLAITAGSGTCRMTLLQAGVAGP